MHRKLLITASSLVAVSAAVTPPTYAQCVHEENAALVMIDVESVPPASGWIEETSLAGFSGTSYYRWIGPDLFDDPGSGILTYTFQIETPGSYNIRVRNYHDHPDGTLENDVWMRVDGEEWLKVFSTPVNQWNFQSIYDLEGGGQPSVEEFFDVGVHELQLSGRSFDFRIDRIHIFQFSNPAPLNPNQPQSPCVQPPPGEEVCFGVGCPCGNDDPTAGCANSSGSGAFLTGDGSTSVAADDLVLTATNIPANNGGLVYGGDMLFTLPLTVGDGFACSGGMSHRYVPQFVDASGVLVKTDLVSTGPAGFIQPGFTRWFQAWTRDVSCGPPPAPCPSPCGNNSNLTNAYRVTFTP